MQSPHHHGGVCVICQCPAAFLVAIFGDLESCCTGLRIRRERDFLFLSSFNLLVEVEWVRNISFINLIAGTRQSSRDRSGGLLDVFSVAHQFWSCVDFLGWSLNLALPKGGIISRVVLGPESEIGRVLKAEGFVKQGRG